MCISLPQGPESLPTARKARTGAPHAEETLSSWAWPRKGAARPPIWAGGQCTYPPPPTLNHHQHYRLWTFHSKAKGMRRTAQKIQIGQRRKAFLLPAMCNSRLGRQSLGFQGHRGLGDRHPTKEQALDEIKQGPVGAPGHQPFCVPHFFFLGHNLQSL